MTIANDYWNGGTGDYSLASNWSLDEVPNSGSDLALYINKSGSVVNLSNATSSADGFFLSAGAKFNLSNAYFYADLSGNNAGTISGSGFGIFTGGTGGGDPLTSGYVFTNKGSISTSVAELDGTISNSGSIVLGSGYSYFNYGLKLTGSGSVVLNGAGLYQASQSGTGTFENAGNTISGYGTFGSCAGITNDAAGVIDADSASGSLTIASGGTDTNAGLLEATGDPNNGNSGVLVLGDAITNSGTIAALENGIVEIDAQVNGGTIHAGNAGDIYANAVLQNCTLDVSSSSAAIFLESVLQGGTLQTENGASVVAINATLDDTYGAVRNTGSIAVGEIGSGTEAMDNVLTLKAGLINSGVITLSGPDADVSLLAGTSLSLQGGGQIVMTDGDGTLINGATRNLTFNNVDNTISGNGSIGLGYLILNNGGTVDATGSSPLSVALSSTTTSLNTGTLEATGTGDLEILRGTLTNDGMLSASGDALVEIGRSVTMTNTAAGTIEASAGGTLNIGALNHNLGLFTNQGTVEALNGTVAIGAGATANLAGGVLTGGTWDVVSTSAGSPAELDFGDAITTDAATIELYGAGSTIQTGSGANTKTIEQSLATIATSGVLAVQYRSYTTGNAITLNGTLNLRFGTFTSGAITGAKGSVISGTGAIASSITDAGTVTVANLSTLTFSGATDAFSGAFIGNGGVSFAGGTVALNSGVTLGSRDTTVAGAAVTLGANLADTGNIHLSSGSLTLGTTTAYRLTVAGTASSFSGGVVNGSGVLTVNGASILSGLTVGGTATLNNNGSLTQNGGNLVLGDSTGAAAKLVNTAKGTYAITDNSGIALGTTVNSAITNAGLFEKTGGTGTSVIAPAIINTGTVTAASGTLDISGAVYGTGHLSILTGATLEFDHAVALNQALSFSGTNDTLLLDDAHDFHAGITGFMSGDTIDLAGFSTGGEKLRYTPNSNNTGGNLSIVSGSQTAVLALVGQYQQANFHIAADSAGSGTLLTFAPVAAHAVITGHG